MNNSDFFKPVKVVFLSVVESLARLSFSMPEIAEIPLATRHRSWKINYFSATAFFQLFLLLTTPNAFSLNEKKKYLKKLFSCVNGDLKISFETLWMNLLVHCEQKHGEYLCRFGGTRKRWPLYQLRGELRIWMKFEKEFFFTFSWTK